MTEVEEIEAIAEIEKRGDQGHEIEAQIEEKETKDLKRTAIKIAGRTLIKNQENVSQEEGEEKMNYLLKRQIN